MNNRHRRVERLRKSEWRTLTPLEKLRRRTQESFRQLKEALRNLGK